MVLPITELWALLLLAAALTCLGSWANLLKFAGPRWRFELFYFDFALGFIAFAVVAAYTLGTLGSEIAFGDRMLVAGRTSQILAFGGGLVFNTGMMLLLAAVSVIGIAAAFPIAATVAMIITAALAIKGANLMLVAGAISLATGALILNIAACRMRSPNEKRGFSATEKGLIAAAVAGMFMSSFSFFYGKSMTGDLSVGPYGGLLMMALGAIVSTAFLSIYFFNIAIQGVPVELKAYAVGTPKQHLYGAASGIVFGAGALAEFLAVSQLSPARLNGWAGRSVPFAAAALPMLWGLASWHEFDKAPRQANLAMWIALVLFAGAAVVVGYAG